MNLKEAIDYMQAEIDDCRGEKCFACRRKSLVLSELKASQNRERDVFERLCKWCRNNDSNGACTIWNNKNANKRMCPLLKEGVK